MGTPEPNTGLERLYRQTGWTLRQFAQEVNRVGTERGTPLKYASRPFISGSGDTCRKRTCGPWSWKLWPAGCAGQSRTAKQDFPHRS
jgi:hypothetical protein